jgi:uncharacterized membrane protein
MPFCATCGAPVEGRFCSKCGSTVTSAGAPVGSVPPGAGPQPIAVAAPMAENVASALCYALGLITGIVFLAVSPYNQSRTVRFNAFQSIFFSACGILLWGFGFIVQIVLSVSSVLRALGVVVSLVLLLIWIVLFGVWLYTVISVYQGKKVVLPVIGPFAERQA